MSVRICLTIRIRIKMSVRIDSIIHTIIRSDGIIRSKCRINTNQY